MFNTSMDFSDIYWKLKYEISVQREEKYIIFYLEYKVRDFSKPVIMYFIVIWTCSLLAFWASNIKFELKK